MVVAALLLVTVILPAEYGRDPLGVGRALGLYRPAAAAVERASDAPGDVEGSTAAPLLESATPFRVEEMSLTLRSGEGAEIKAVMGQGQRFVFSWTATGGAGVDVDMHGEGTGRAEGQSTSYLKGEWQKEGHGAFEAPWPGNHGWFWQNLNDDPVTVTVKVIGFYDKLFRP